MLAQSRPPSPLPRSSFNAPLLLAARKFDPTKLFRNRTTALWQVIYQEAIRGHHLLFKRADVDLFETIQMNAHTADYGVFESLEEIVVDLVSSNDLNTMIQIIDALPITQRHSLFLFYQRALWIWKNYSKDQLN